MQRQGGNKPRNAADGRSSFCALQRRICRSNKVGERTDDWSEVTYAKPSSAGALPTGVGG